MSKSGFAGLGEADSSGFGAGVPADFQRHWRWPAGVPITWAYRTNTTGFWYPSSSTSIMFGCIMYELRCNHFAEIQIKSINWFVAHLTPAFESQEKAKTRGIQRKRSIKSFCLGPVAPRFSIYYHSIKYQFLSILSFKLCIPKSLVLWGFLHTAGRPFMMDLKIK